MNSMKESIGAKLKQARKDKGYTLQYVAEYTGYSPSYIHRIENNSRKGFSYMLYNKLIDLYGLETEVPQGLELNEEIYSDLLQLMDKNKESISKLKFIIEQSTDSMNTLIKDIDEIETEIDNRLTAMFS